VRGDRAHTTHVTTFRRATLHANTK
jgi:hypothetical protein